jgi:hypothetical protein
MVGLYKVRSDLTLNADAPSIDTPELLIVEYGGSCRLKTQPKLELLYTFWVIKEDYWLLVVLHTVVLCSGNKESKQRLVLECLYQISSYISTDCLSVNQSSESASRTYLARLSQKTSFAFTMMYSTTLCTRLQSYPRWSALTKTKPPTLLTFGMWHVTFFYLQKR